VEFGRGIEIRGRMGDQRSQIMFEEVERSHDDIENRVWEGWISGWRAIVGSIWRDMAPNTTVSTSATLFREEAVRARRYAAAMTDKSVIDRLNEIAAIYDELAAGQDPGDTDRE
jgi:hypothetical protein